MGLSISTLIEAILIIAGLVAAFGVLAGITSALMNMDVACRVSVELVTLGIGNGLHCKIVQDAVPAKDFKNPSDTAAQTYIGKSMLTCWNTFGNGKIDSIESHARVGFSSVPAVLSGKFPIHTELTHAYYCHVCSIINVSDPVQNMKSFLVNAQVGSQTYDQRLYPNSERQKFAALNSASFATSKGPNGKPQPDKAYVVYVEGAVGGPTTNGVVVMNEADFDASVGQTPAPNGQTLPDVCGRYLG